jgi:hypothetical protein
MEVHPQPTASCDPTVYEIRVAGQLSSRWFDWFDGFEVTNLDGGQVLLRGVCVDQSALRGVLEKIFNLHLRLISLDSENSFSLRR